MKKGKVSLSRQIREFDSGYIALCTEESENAFGYGSPKDNRAQRKRLLMLLHHAIQQELTAAQRAYFMAYYREHLTMKAIGERYGVTESTVSRTIQRGRRRLQKAFSGLKKEDFR